MSADLCGARLLYRGRTRAKCHRPAGHDGKHCNFTVQWSDNTPDAIPDTSVVTRSDLFSRDELEVVLRTWFDDDDAAGIADWIATDPETVVTAAYEYYAEHHDRPVEDVNTGGRI